MKLTTKKYKGHIGKVAFVHTNDPKNPRVEIRIRGSLWGPIYVSKNRVTLRARPGEQVEGTVKIQGKMEKRLELGDISVSDPDKLGAQIDKGADEQSYVLRIRSNLNGKGHHTGRVKLATNYPEHPEISINVNIVIESPLQVRPKVLIFKGLSAKHFKELERSGRFDRPGPVRPRAITVFLTEGDSLKIEKLELEKSLFAVTTTETQPGKRYRLTVTPIMAKLSAGKNRDSLRIYTNQQDNKLVKVPIRFDIQ